MYEIGEISSTHTVDKVSRTLIGNSIGGEECLHYLLQILKTDSTKKLN
jgi:hypothetical protein